MTLISLHIDSENGEKIIYERVVMRSGLLLATVGGLALLSLGCGDETSDAVERWDKACQAYCDAEEECKDPGWARCRSECSQDRRKIESQSVERSEEHTSELRHVAISYA